jgi:hypothetical protein
LSALDLSLARAHDLGGQPGGPVNPAEHQMEPWNLLVTAIFAVLGDPAHRLIRVDEVRRAIEDMPTDDYRRLEYFDRWATALATLVVEKGLMSREEIERRIAAVAGDR